MSRYPKRAGVNVDVIISSIVGEEGVDLPEAGLLVFLDTTKSPLRFYQRLGRLIRARSSRPVKYLVGVYTVGTSEYESLPAGVSNLLAEGIDVSFVVVNLEEKGLYRALKQYLITLVGGGSRIPLPEEGVGGAKVVYLHAVVYHEVDWDQWVESCRVPVELIRRPSLLRGRLLLGPL